MNVNKENLIEGIGDEVLIVISLLLITFIVFLLWLSKDLNCFPGSFRRILHPAHLEESTNESDSSNDIEEISETENEDNLTKPVENEINNIDLVDKSCGDNQNNASATEEACPDGFISIKLKYLNDKTIIVFANPQSTVLNFKRTNFQEELNNNKTVRLIYNGRELKELNGEITLAEYGLVHNSTIHCLVTARRDNPNTSTTSTDNSVVSSDINIGSLMFPLFGFILSLIWYYRLNYKHHFNMVTTFALIGITGVYFVSCCVTYSSPAPRRRDSLIESIDSSR